MTRIEKELNFFQRYRNYILLFLSAIMAFVFVFPELKEGKLFDIIPLLYLFAGTLYILAAVGIYRRKRNSEYISWDSEKLVFAKISKKPRVFMFKNITKVSMTTKNLVVESIGKRNARISLKNFSEKDLEELQANLEEFNKVPLSVKDKT